MLVSDISEFDLIDKLSCVLGLENERRERDLRASGFDVFVGIGDDGAVWEDISGVKVLTTDTLVEGVHFTLNHSDWHDLGWKTLAVNLSDLAAMGAIPLCSVVTLGLTADIPVNGLLDMYKGMAEISNQYGGAVIGGDIVKSGVFFVTVAMYGRALKRHKILTRGSAKPGDKIGVTGHIGCSSAGFHSLTEISEVNYTDDIQHLRTAHFRPKPRINEGMLLVRHGVRTGMDISDGLIGDLMKLCQSSGVGAVVRSMDVPADQYLKRSYPKKWLDFALSGGEDYELLFTARPDIVQKLAGENDIDFSIIGDITSGISKVRVIDECGRDIDISKSGWDHLASDKNSIK